MNLEQKLRAVAYHGLCTNCLAQSHRRSQCQSIDRCRICKQDHNTWLHPLEKGQIWFRMTAEIRIVTWPGHRAKETRVLIDPNAARSSITADEAERLNCFIHEGRTTVTVFHRRYNDKRNILIDCAVEDRDYGYNPIARINREFQQTREHAAAINDADPWWFEKRRYFMVLGADVTKEILVGRAQGRPGGIYSQETIFGQTFFGASKIVPLDPRMEG